MSHVPQYIRHLRDAIRGEYRDRIMVRHNDLRMYTSALKSFEDFQYKVSSIHVTHKLRLFIQSIQPVDL